MVVARGIDALFSFINRGWKLDAPFAIHSTSDRTGILVPKRISQCAVSLRNHLRLWLAPFTMDGSRDIDIKLTAQSWYLTTHRISPMVDQDRFYLLQALIMSGADSRFGVVLGVGASSTPHPRVNLTGSLTDGLRRVVFLDLLRRSFQHIEFLQWVRAHP